MKGVGGGEKMGWWWWSLVASSGGFMIDGVVMVVLGVKELVAGKTELSLVIGSVIKKVLTIQPARRDNKSSPATGAGLCLIIL